MTTNARGLRVKAERKAGKKAPTGATGYVSPTIDPRAVNRAGARVRKPLRPLQRGD